MKSCICCLLNYLYPRILSLRDSSFCVCVFFFNNNISFHMLFMQCLKVSFHLQFLQVIGPVSRVVQYIPEPILYPVVCASHFPAPIFPLPPPLVTIGLLSICDNWFGGRLDAKAKGRDIRVHGDISPRGQP